MLLYSLAIQILRAAVRMASAAGHPKSRRAWRGRIGWEDRLKQADADTRLSGRTGDWLHLHCASLGEYEQGAPLLERWRDRHPERPILLTFFSPSGVEGAHATLADHVDYLPFDTSGAMRRFAAAISISDTVLVKYELWPALIQHLTAHGTRVHLVAARFDAGRHPMSAWGWFIRRHMQALRTILVQDAQSAAVAKSFGVSTSVMGDPRLDRVASNVLQAPPAQVQERLDRIGRWAASRPLLVVGSAWPPEWQALASLQSRNTEWCILWAPHEVDAGYVTEWAQAGHTARLSAWEEASANADEREPSMMILDEIGVLKYAYGLADIAVVGGGWGKGVHNTLEPAAFGVPVLTGPGIGGFREVQALLQCGAAEVCHTPDSLAERALDWMKDKPKRHRAGAAGAHWVQQHVGAAERIVDAIERDGKGGK